MEQFEWGRRQELIEIWLFFNNKFLSLKQIYWAWSGIMQNSEVIWGEIADIDADELVNSCPYVGSRYSIENCILDSFGTWV